MLSTIKKASLLFKKWLYSHTLQTRLLLWNFVILLSMIILWAGLYQWYEQNESLADTERLLQQSLSIQLQSIQNWRHAQIGSVTAAAHLPSVRAQDIQAMKLDFGAAAYHHNSLGYAFVNVHGLVEVDTIGLERTKIDNSPAFLAGLSGETYSVWQASAASRPQGFMLFSAPVYNADNRFAGILLAAISPDSLTTIMQSFKAGYSSKAYLLDKSGTVIASSTSEKKAIETNTGFRRAQQGQSGISTYTDQFQKTVIGAYQWLPQYNMILLCEIDKDEALLLYQEQLNRMLVSMLLILLVSSLLTWQLARTLRNPIELLSDAAIRIQNGNYQEMIPTAAFTQAPADLRKLCSVFNFMMSTVKSHVSLLNMTNQALSAAESKYRLLSTRDPLTGLYNRTYFEGELLRLTSVDKLPMCIVVCDIDGLKIINDTLGHQAGDELIRSAAHLLSQSFRPFDMIARIGGDEFVIIMTTVDQTTVAACLYDLDTAIREHNQQHPDLPIVVSKGSAFVAAPPFHIDDLFRDADNAMYIEKNRNREKTRIQLLETLNQAACRHAPTYAKHIAGVKQYALAFGQYLNLTEEQLALLSLTAEYHDIGKLAVPSNILLQEGPLSPEDFQEIQRHAEVSSRIAKSLPFLFPVAEYIASHHERWDGAGYPHKMKGEEIPLISRIIAIADAFDAMQRDQPHQKARSLAEACQELERYAGTQFDPTLVHRFLTHIAMNTEQQS